MLRYTCIRSVSKFLAQFKFFDEGPNSTVSADELSSVIHLSHSSARFRRRSDCGRKRSEPQPGEKERTRCSYRQRKRDEAIYFACELRRIAYARQISSTQKKKKVVPLLILGHRAQHVSAMLHAMRSRSEIPSWSISIANMGVFHGKILDVILIEMVATMH